MSKRSEAETLITTVKDLGDYFYQSLSELNKMSLGPLPEEAIIYSSNILGRYCRSQEFFEISNGKVKDKFLGLKLLESSQQTKEQQKRILKDVGDSSLFVCGYFAESLNLKLVDVSFYQQIGKTAYLQLNKAVPELFDVPFFYQQLAESFQELTLLINLLAHKNKQNSDPLDSYIINYQIPGEKKKVS